MNKSAPRRCLTFGLVSLMMVCALVGVGRAQMTAKSLLLPVGATDLGAVPASQAASMTLYLTPTADQQAALTGFLKDVQTPGSTNFRAWMTPAAFDAEFAVTAEQMAAVGAFAQSNGLAVGKVSGLRVEVMGTAGQVETALAPALHAVAMAGKTYTAMTAVPVLPAGLAGVVSAVDGLSTLPKTDVLTAMYGGVAWETQKGLLPLLSEMAEANAGLVAALSTSDCVEDFDAGTAAAVQFELRQMNAEGVTVLAQSGCGGRGSAGFPATLSEVTAVAAAPGIMPGTAVNLSELRPVWQVASGLPADGLRHEVDVTVPSLAALARTMETILAKQPQPKDGSLARLGNVNATLYAITLQPGLYTQPDKAVAGTWEAATGLGLVDLQKLADVFPNGTYSDYVSISMPNYSPTHGTNATFTSAVSDTSGQTNNQTATGSVTFLVDGVTSLGPSTLSNGTTTYNYNQLKGGSHTVQATYTGDGTYAGATSNTITFSINPEVTQLAVASVSGGATVGGTVSVKLTETASSGVGTPTGSVNITPQGTSDTTVYTQPWSGSAGVASATFSLPAVQGGTDTFQAQCPQPPTDPNFTCSPNTLNFTAGIGLGTPTMTLTMSPTNPTAGQTATFTATLAGSGGKYPVPQGNITYKNNGTTLGTATLNASGVATYSTANLALQTTNLFTATYGGDNNYQTVSATANATTTATATTTALTISPTVPSGGSPTTLTATVTYTLTNGAAPTGSMGFYEDGALLASATVTNGVATYTSSTITTQVSHQFYAVYSGDANYVTSTSPVVTTSAGLLATSTAMTVTPNPPVAGSTTTLSAKVTYTGVALPTGTVAFYEDGALLTTAAVSSAAATYTSTTLSGTKAHTFYAVYSGDSNNATSTSPTVSTSANTATITTTTFLAMSPNPPVSGDATAMTAVIGYSGSTSTPTGTVAFYQDAVQLGTAAVSGTSASYASSGLTTTKAHSYTATYSGDSTFIGSTSSAVTTQATSGTVSTSIIVTAGTPTVVSGGTDALTATVSPASLVNGVLPTGAVTFTLGSPTGTLLCSGTVSTYVATCSATLTTVGAQTIYATYAGDTNYATSTTASPAAVTVTQAAVAGTITVSVAPGTSVMYGATVTLTSVLTGATLTSAPTGTVTFTLAGTVGATYTANLVATTTTSSTASTTIAAPTPGTYTVTATCTSANVTCTGLSAVASLVTIKGNTTTTISASPTSPQAGQTTTITATVSPSVTLNGAATLPTGTVTFYINGSTPVATQTLTSSGVATYTTVLTAVTGNYITAVYSGDTNWNGSSSSTIDVLIAPVPTTSNLSANETTALYTANVVLTTTVLVTPTALNPNPVSPYGTVTFYDLYNGQTLPLGTASLTAIVPGQAIAQLSTTGLQKGTHNITALFGASTAYASSTSTITINITDYGVSFSPQTLSLTRGSGGAAIATITAYNGFSGQVVLGCTPPASSLMTCSFSPAVIQQAGTSVLSVTTTAVAMGVAPKRIGEKESGIALAAVSLGSLLLGLMLPGGKRRRSYFVAMVAAVVLLAAGGCTVVSSSPTGNITGGGSGTGGTPQGTQLLTITTSGTDGVTIVRHNTQFQVTVQ